MAMKQYARQCGMVLAGGKATRLDNKALLPIGDNIVIESSLNLLKRSGIKEEDTYVLVRRESIIPDVLLHRGWNKLNFVVQPEGVIGVCTAIQTIRNSIDDETWNRHWYVTFCDNLYDSQMACVHLRADEKELQMTIKSSDNEQLDRYDGKRWISRDMAMPHQVMCIAGYLSMHQDVLKSLKGESLLAELNRLGAKPYDISSYHWRDVGIPNEYRKALKEISGRYFSSPETEDVSS